MGSFWGRLRGVYAPRVAVAGLLVLLAGELVGFGYGVATARATTAGVVAASGLAAIALSGLLYAWRPGALLNQPQDP